MRRPVVLGVWLGVWLGGLAPAGAELRVEGEAWDDLSRFALAHRAAGGEVRAGEAVDLGQVPAGSGLALIAPGPVADPAGVRRFVQEGGRVLVAIDDASADALLREFETASAPAPEEGERLGGHAALVVVRTPNARTFTGVGALVTNHPMALAPIGVLDPAVRFADGTPFAWHLKLGEGELLLLGDASLLINLMLDAGGNRVFAANVASWLSQGGTRPLTVVGGGVPLTGTYGTPPPEGVDSINQTLSNLVAQGEPDALLVYALLGLLLGAVTAYTLLIFPGRATRRPGPSRPAAVTGTVERGAGAPGGPAAPDGHPTPAAREPA